MDKKVLRYWLLRTLILAIILAIIFQVFDLWTKRSHVYFVGLAMGIFYSFLQARRKVENKN